MGSGKIADNKVLINYRSFSPGSDTYKREYSKRLILRSKINSALGRDYEHKQKIVNHFFNNDKSIPVWAVFESITLGEFGTFFSCLDKPFKVEVSKLLKLPSNLDSDGQLTQYIIYTLRDLRNAIAHNNVIFDTRFCTSTINGRLIRCLKSETTIQNITFNSIEDYIILVTYFLKKTQISKAELRQFVKKFSAEVEILRNELPTNIYNQIINTNVNTKLQLLDTYISKN